MCCIKATEFAVEMHSSHQHADIRADYRVILTKMATTLSDDMVFYEYFALCAKY